MSGYPLLASYQHRVNPDQYGLVSGNSLEKYSTCQQYFLRLGKETAELYLSLIFTRPPVCRRRLHIYVTLRSSPRNQIIAFNNGVSAEITNFSFSLKISTPPCTLHDSVTQLPSPALTPHSPSPPTPLVPAHSCPPTATIRCQKNRRGYKLSLPMLRCFSFLRHLHSFPWTPYI